MTAAQVQAIQLAVGSLLVLLAYLLRRVVKQLVLGAPAVAPPEQRIKDAMHHVAGKAAAIRVLEQLDVSGSRQESPPSSS